MSSATVKPGIVSFAAALSLHKRSRVAEIETRVHEGPPPAQIENSGPQSVHIDNAVNGSIITASPPAPTAPDAGLHRDPSRRYIGAPSHQSPRVLRVYILCIASTSVGFIFVLISVLVLVWTLQSCGMSIFISAVLVVGVLSLGAVLIPDNVISMVRDKLSTSTNSQSKRLQELSLVVITRCRQVYRHTVHLVANCVINTRQIFEYIFGRRN
ncbi:hypothetical protein CONPUDRAFT_137128 [Coniophora puteana RWD-64-598 SS2]|uniref:Uncharacterized protein n=1 Tax=Coniophora puteana (strain RWD-64-598) TaxID=741705 RepID=A0A5M3MQU1_CONPW|nr:uncharacterized protein CONPUDRAFT_137128 [Coniophora puteana RWD-64-598 SS2]EIW81015.1 hypothetical protein CONPUDRAFT_137128 [Coniophora puteana RWD-64-598 SS2]